MIIFNGWVQISFLILIGMLAFKTMIGFHWPWEKCECCGKKYKDHKKDLFKEGFNPTLKSYGLDIGNEDKTILTLLEKKKEESK